MFGIIKIEVDFIQDINSEPITLYGTGVLIDEGKRAQYYHPVTGKFEIKELK